jgi:hypothetical protein
MFQQGGYLDKLNKGELTQTIIRQSHPAPNFLPYCTRSQMLAYHDSKGKKLAIVHQYLKPDGKLGASGLPDPKLLVHDGKRYHAVAAKH